MMITRKIKSNINANINIVPLTPTTYLMEPNVTVCDWHM